MTKLCVTFIQIEWSIALIEEDNLFEKDKLCKENLSFLTKEGVGRRQWNNEQINTTKGHTVLKNIYL